MCGIAGWLSFEEDVREKRDALEAMSGTLANRGPDDHGMYITPSAGLVHRRLAVVDIAGGRQPMREGDYTIVYNGELYNTEELRQELAGSGWEFRGHSDTEVLLKAFVQWGEGCLDRLSGIYSFAVWNERQRRLFAARDRVGVKPFFFYEDGRRFIFGSVIPALAAAAPWCEGLAPRLDEEGRRQLVSDVPLCTMLSGGLDSSILSALAGAEYRKQGKTLHTWSVDYADSSQYFRAGRFVPSEDAPYAAEMADRIGSEHHIVTLDNVELADALSLAAVERGLPGMADVDSSLLLFCLAIREQFTVGLSGECADELFGGYPWYHRDEILFEECFPWSRSVSVRDQILSPAAVGTDGEDWLREAYRSAVARTDLLPGEDARAARMRQMFRLNFDWFMQTLLARKDTMSMACGLEMRVPFADERIVEYAYNLPWELKNLDGREKGILRAAFEDVLTPGVAWRKKSPYPKTFHPAYFRRVLELYQRRLERPGGALAQLVDTEALNALAADSAGLKEPWYGQLMRTPQVFAWLVMLDVWMERFHVELV